MTTHQWRWQRVDRPGIWAFGGSSRNVSPKIIKVSAYEGHPNNIEQWYCYLGPVPTIAPPEPELRLPEGWNSDTKSVANRVTSIEAWSEEAPNHMGIEIRHPDRATAIRAVQKAVEEMEAKTCAACRMPVEPSRDSAICETCHRQMEKRT